MFISVILWSLVICIITLGIYYLYDDKKSKKDDKEDLY